MSTKLWSIVATLVAVSVLVLAACAPATAPSPSTAPEKAASSAAGAKASAPGPSTSGSPAGQGAGSAAKPSASEAKPAPAADWKAEWDSVVAAAKKEGKVVVAGGPGQIYHNAALAFQKAYPEIQLEFTGIMGRDFAPKVLAERDGNQYLWDVHVDGTTPPLGLRDKGALDPLKPALILPEVLDDSKWAGGFEDGFTDKEHKYVYALEGRVRYTVYVNRDMVVDAELSSIDQLLDPKWKGKIITTDPRLPGPSTQDTSTFLQANGEDWYRKFLVQGLVIMSDERAVVESIVRSRYPVALGFDTGTLDTFKKEGLAGQVKPLDPDNLAGRTISTGYGNATLLNKAPHPNAAKVFLNWFFSKDGQKAYTDATGLNSRRFDVQGPPDFAIKPGVKYTDFNKEESVPVKNRAAEIAREAIK